MKDYLQFYIDGQWVEPLAAETLDVISPATENTIARIALASVADVDRAVEAARGAFTMNRDTHRSRHFRIAQPSTRHGQALDARLQRRTTTR
ncbi:MAG: aldehyde dehydrogenase family protein [Gammaproteobacteria bacterium]|nr:aldehyde dehydrogenase family protein [Gammaproteobacteria bacterium]